MQAHPIITSLADWLMETSWQVAMLVALIFVLQWILRRWLSPGMRYAMWMLVALRLVLPLLPASECSIFNLVRVGQTPVTATAHVESSAPTPRWTVTYNLAPSKPNAGTAAAAAAQTTRFAWDGRHAAVAVWLLGVSLLGVRFASAWRRLARVAREALPIEIDDVLAACRRQLRFDGAVTVRETSAVRSPCLWGLHRPCILLPDGLAERLTRTQLRLVLLHELAHIRRRDHWGNQVLGLLQILHWFNPAVWFALSRCRLERELACDQSVLRASGQCEHEIYGQTLLQIATQSASQGFAASALPMAEGKSHLKSRIRMIARGQGGRTSVLVGIALTVVVALVALTRMKPPAAAEHAPDPMPTRDASMPQALTRVYDVSELLRAGEEANPKDIQTEHVKAKAVELRKAILENVAPQSWRKTDVYAVVINPDSRQLRITQTEDAHVAVERLLNRKRKEAGLGPLAYYTNQATDYVAPNSRDVADAAPLDLMRMALKGPIDFKHTPLEEALTRLQEETGISILVDWGALEAAGVGRKTSIDARLQDVSYEKALSVVLDVAAGRKLVLLYSIYWDFVEVTTIDPALRPIVTRVYNITDLIGMASTTQPAAETNGHAAAEEGGQSDRVGIAEDVAGLIRDTVATDSWTAGGVIRVAPDGKQLVIAQTERNQRAIHDLLAQLRETKELEVMVETHFVLLDAEKLAGKLGIDIGSPAAPAKEKIRGLYLSPKQVQRLFDHLSEVDGQMTPGPKLLLLNGREAQVKAVNSTSYVSGVEPNQQKGEAGKRMYRSVAEDADDGLAMKIRPTISADRKYVTMHLDYSLKRLLEMTPFTFTADDTPHERLTIQEPRSQELSVDTLVSVADGQTLVLGGQTVEPTATTRPDSPADVDKGHRTLLILVRPTIINLHRSAEKP